MTVATKMPEFAAAFLETCDIKLKVKLTKKDFKNCKKVCLALSEMPHYKKERCCFRMKLRTMMIDKIRRNVAVIG